MGKWGVHNLKDKGPESWQTIEAETPEQALAIYWQRCPTAPRGGLIYIGDPPPCNGSKPPDYQELTE